MTIYSYAATRQTVIASFFRVTIQVVPNILLTSKQKLHFSIRRIYRVTQHLVPNLPLTLF